MAMGLGWGWGWGQVRLMPYALHVRRKKEKRTVSFVSTTWVSKEIELTAVYTHQDSR